MAESNESKDKFWQYFDDDAKDYLSTIMEAEGDFYRKSAEYVNADIPKDSDVLDIGNGGVINYDISGINHLTCADIYIVPRVANAYKSVSKITFVESDITDMNNVNDNSFDAVIVQNVIHHLAEDTYRLTYQKTVKALTECVRVLKPGGVLLICESTAKPWFERMERLFYRLMMQIIDIVKFDHVYQYSAKSLCRMLDKHLKDAACIETTENIGQGKYTVFLGRKVPSWLLPLTVTYLKVRKNEGR